MAQGRGAWTAPAVPPTWDAGTEDWVPVPLREPEDEAEAHRQREARVHSLLQVPYGRLSADDKSFLQGYTKRDQSVAKHYSSLRWDPNADSLIQRLRKAKRTGGQLSFEGTAGRIANEYGVQLKEVYTLFHSS